MKRNEANTRRYKKSGYIADEAISFMHYTAQYCIVLHCTAQYCTVLHSTALYCTVLQSTALYCTALYCWYLLVVWLAGTLYYAANPRLAVAKADPRQPKAW